MKPIQSKKPTEEEVEKYIFQKWNKVLTELAKGPSEPYPAWHMDDLPKD